MEAVAAGDEVAVQFVRRAVVGEADQRGGFDVVQRDVAGFVQDGAAGSGVA